ncbi:MAG: hypothetical protein IJ681_05535 [Bacteroidales bacterium]|nr:hypothetical protein [Bacteroidales bacterium]
MDRTIIKRNFYAELLILVIFGAIAILSSSIAVRLLTYLIALVLVIALSISELKTYSKKDYWLLFFSLYAKAICLTYVVFQVSNYPGNT